MVQENTYSRISLWDEYVIMVFVNLSDLNIVVHLFIWKKWTKSKSTDLIKYSAKLFMSISNHLSISFEKSLELCNLRLIKVIFKKIEDIDYMHADRMYW